MLEFNTIQIQFYRIEKKSIKILDTLCESKKLSIAKSILLKKQICHILNEIKKENNKILKIQKHEKIDNEYQIISSILNIIDD